METSLRERKGRAAGALRDAGRFLPRRRGDVHARAGYSSKRKYVSRSLREEESQTTRKIYSP